MFKVLCVCLSERLKINGLFVLSRIFDIRRYFIWRWGLYLEKVVGFVWGGGNLSVFRFHGFEVLLVF